MRELSNHGQDKRYHHARIGINGRLDTIQAAVLLAKLAIFAGEIEKRIAVGARYSQLLAADGIITPYIAPDNTSVYAQYTIQVEGREKVQKALAEKGIPTAVHYPIPLNKQPAMHQEHLSFPVTEQLAQRVISLPMHPYLGQADQDAIASAVREGI